MWFELGLFGSVHRVGVTKEIHCTHYFNTWAIESLWAVSLLAVGSQLIFCGFVCFPVLPQIEWSPEINNPKSVRTTREVL